MKYDVLRRIILFACKLLIINVIILTTITHFATTANSEDACVLKQIWRLRLNPN